jgi:hypothetical protein
MSVSGLYERLNVWDTDDAEAPEVGAEALSVWSDGAGWWSASADLDDGEE